MKMILTCMIATAALVAGCGGSSSSGGGDPGTDTGTPTADTGTVGGGDTGPGGTDTGPKADTGPGGTDTGPKADTGPGGTDTGPGGTDTGGGDTTTGGNTISGSADGTPFDTVSMALWFGAPDDPATTVIYVFSKPVKCSDFSTPGWDKRITDKTQFLEMKMFGLTPATYTVTTSATPAPGEASVNYTLSSTSGVPVETASSGGTVTLSTITPTTNATGSFALHFGANNLNGTYDATYCPGGHEP